MEAQAHWIPEHESLGTTINDKQFEVIVVGGGYAGLSAAATLSANGKQVAILEAKYCGYGASGRNAGHLTPTIGKDVPSLLLMFSKEKVKQLIHTAEQAVEYTEQIIEDSDQSCDYVATGNIMAAVTRSQLKRLKKNFEIAADLGVDAQFLDELEMNERQIPPAFIGGVLEQKGGGLHPGKYLEILKTRALKSGAKIIENTPVIEVRKQTTGFELYTENQGVFKANKVLICTNAFKPLHSYLKHKSTALTVSLVETTPLTNEQLNVLNWPNKEGIYTAHEMLESYRLTAQNTIVAGSKTVTYQSRPENLGVPGKTDHQQIINAFRQRFPELGDIGFDAQWSGPIAFSLDFLPIIKTLDKGLISATTFAGHGIAMATYGGHLAAQMLLEKQPKNYLINRKAITIPPDPLRGWVANAMIKTFAWLDKRADKEVVRR